jgi:hypothetical protein
MDYQRIVTYLNTENRQLRDAVVKLGAKVGERTYHPRRVRLAYEDALLMAVSYSGGTYPSREYMMQYKEMSRARFDNALALLRMARVVKRKWLWPARREVHFPTIEKAVGLAKTKATDKPESYRLWLR